MLLDGREARPFYYFVSSCPALIFTQKLLQKTLTTSIEGFSATGKKSLSDGFIPLWAMPMVIIILT